MSKRAVEELIAGLCPQPPVPAIVRRLPGARPHPASAAMLEATQAGMQAPIADPPGRAATVVPLAPQRYKVQFTARAETHEKLRQVQALLRHQIPDGDLDQIVDRALTALLEKLAREKLAATEHPRRARSTTHASRHIPADVKRAVWLRDGGRCAFVGARGRRCSETGFLEFHHVKPYAAGGESSIDNLQLRCRAHNGFEAELYFGPHDRTEVREPHACYSVRTEFEHHRGSGSASGSYGHPGGSCIRVPVNRPIATLADEDLE